MRFFSDNAAAVCAPVMEALGAVNVLDTAYDEDAQSKALDALHGGECLRAVVFY